MLYDLVTLSISTVFLFNVNTRDKRFSRMIKMWVFWLSVCLSIMSSLYYLSLFYDGLGYFVVLTGKYYRREYVLRSPLASYRFEYH
jgi:hypothetical protein